MIFLYLLILAVGFELLYRGSDIFVDGSVALAERFEIPQFVIGLTIVAMGTSLPEAAVSIMAAVSGSSEISVGNVIGSDIFNILIILGVSAVITPLAVSRKALNLGMPFMAFCAYLMYAVGKDGLITRGEGISFLVMFFIYLIVLIGVSWKNKYIAEKKILISLNKTILLILIGLIAIIIGSRATVFSATGLARMFNVSERLIALTIVALGTSLPELFTSVNAAKKGNANIAVANIVGSNIFNILLIMGASALINEVEYDGEFMIDAIVNTGVSILLFAMCFMKYRLSRLGGAILLVLYGVYFFYLIYV